MARAGSALAVSFLGKAKPAYAGDADLGQRLLMATPPHGERSLGRSDAPVVLVEYASATSESCAAFQARVLPALLADYIDSGKVRFIFREFPMDQRALAVFMLTRCIPEAKYFSTLDMIFQRQTLWKGSNIKPELMRIMGSAGMSEDDFIACLKRKDLARAIYAVRAKARDEFGVEDTPTFFVNGRKVDDHENVAAVTAVIQAALQAN